MHRRWKRPETRKLDPGHTEAISITEAQLEGLRLDKTHFEKVSFDGKLI